MFYKKNNCCGVKAKIMLRFFPSDEYSIQIGLYTIPELDVTKNYAQLYGMNLIFVAK